MCYCCACAFNSHAPLIDARLDRWLFVFYIITIAFNKTLNRVVKFSGSDMPMEIIDCYAYQMLIGTEYDSK